LVNPSDCPEIAVVQAVYHFFLPTKPGDTARSELRMKSCSRKKPTSLGEGYFITTERLFYKQRNELIRAQDFTIFHYRPLL
jgi:hypothetical protein